jgi:hypothetical protein
VYLDEFGNTLDEVGISLRAVDAIPRALGTLCVEYGVNRAYLCANLPDNSAMVSGGYANLAEHRVYEA